ncbi:helix-turn-helix protein [compost metagenome]
MIGLEYIVKLYNGTYKKLAEKLEITPSTVTDWLSKRRPIPKAKLEALSKLFNLEAEYFQKELTKMEEIELRLDYLNRRSRRESFEIPEFFTDEDGKEYQSTRMIDPYEDERRLAEEELDMEKVILRLHSSLYEEALDFEKEKNSFEILDRISNIFYESVPAQSNVKQQAIWEKKHQDRIDALRSMMYFMGVKGYGVLDEEEESFHNELFQLLKKYDLLWLNE